MGAYLFVFPYSQSFYGNESRWLYLPTVNDGQPIIAVDTVAEQRGVRDPHISRGPDGAFYLCMTDLHIFAKNAESL